jgi:hypothetical protein
VRFRGPAFACLLLAGTSAAGAQESAPVRSDARAAQEPAPAPSSAAAGAIAIEVTPKEATVGDPIGVRLSVDLPAGAEAAPLPPGTEMGPFTVLSGGWRQEDAAGGRKRWIWSGAVAAYETGKLTLPPISVRAKEAGGETELRTEPLELTIKSVLPAPSAGDKAPEPADLKAPASIPPDFTVLKRALMIVGLLLAIAGLAWWLHKRYASRLARVEAPEDPFRRVPPHVWVYEELKRLLDRRLAEEGKIDVFFAELSHIMKKYLGGRYRVDLLERTTEEVVPILSQAGAPREPARAARSLLERCDLVKFARAWPDPGACRTEVEEAYRIVDATRPAEASASEGAA